MKILESYKKIVKSMLIEHAWDRKFGESLPTLEDVMNEADVMSHVIKYKDEDGNDIGRDMPDADLIPANESGEHISITSRLGKKDAMYVSVINQLITMIDKAKVYKI